MKVAVMGYGVVGSGVVEVFYKNHKNLLKKTGQDEMEVKYILDLRDFPGDPYEDKIIKDFEMIENDPEIEVVVETMGGINPAFDFLTRCLKSGKSVVTSNKELVAEKGLELFETANKYNKNFMFEASVGGGIPIIRPIQQCLAANEIDEIAGIMNGTTNFILTKMIKDNMGFQEALKMAQDLGYAEKDPTADVEGDDTCRKICILASLAFGKQVYPEQVNTEGISAIRLEDVEYISSWGGVIKLLGRSKRLEDGRITACVSPAVISKSSQLAGVDDVFNAILVRGNATGDVVFYGRGAGKLPTASAVVADVIDCVNHRKEPKYRGWKKAEENYTADSRELATELYIRVETSNVKEARFEIEAKFGDVRELKRRGAPKSELAFILPEAIEFESRNSLKSLKNCSILNVIRICDY